ncbi:MAG: stage III sporulation protein AG [Bacillota bacterium]|nr:stage III sporulation protein AG [Bacillota bacterium]
MNLNKLLEYINKLTSKKNASNLIIVLLIGVLLIVVSNFFKSTSTAATASAGQGNQQPVVKGYSDLNQYEDKRKAEITSILGKIKGIGQVEVGITFDSNEEEIPAINDNTSTTTTNITDNAGGKNTTTQSTSGTTVVTSTNGSDTEPYILKRLTPKVAGIVIVAQGAEKSEIRSSIIAAVSCYFGIPNYKIQVCPMK